jgi:hypothetical protein
MCFNRQLVHGGGQDFLSLCEWNRRWGTIHSGTFSNLRDELLAPQGSLSHTLPHRRMSPAPNFLHFGPSSEKNSRLDPKKF